MTLEISVGEGKSKAAPLGSVPLNTARLSGEGIEVNRGPLARLAIRTEPTDYLVGEGIQIETEEGRAGLMKKVGAIREAIKNAVAITGPRMEEIEESETNRMLKSPHGLGCPNEGCRPLFVEMESTRPGKNYGVLFEWDGYRNGKDNKWPVTITPIGERDGRVVYPAVSFSAWVSYDGGIEVREESFFNRKNEAGVTWAKIRRPDIPGIRYEDKEEAAAQFIVAILAMVVLSAFNGQAHN